MLKVEHVTVDAANSLTCFTFFILTIKTVHYVGSNYIFVNFSIFCKRSGFNNVGSFTIMTIVANDAYCVKKRDL